MAAPAKDGEDVLAGVAAEVTVDMLMAFNVELNAHLFGKRHGAIGSARQRIRHRKVLLEAHASTWCFRRGRWDIEGALALIEGCAMELGTLASDVLFADTRA